MAVLGIDIGGTHLRGARVEGGRIMARAAQPSHADPAEVLARVLALVAGLRDDSVTALGIGVPGQVHAATRRVVSGGYVDLSGFDFAGRVQEATGLPVTLENDATMALIAEARLGAARGRSNVVMLTIGTGIGGAVIEGGRLLRGRGAAGQLGHLVVDPQGRPCVCGRIGCVETLSSGTAFGVHLAEAGLPGGTRAEDLLAEVLPAGGDARGHAVLLAWATPLRAAIETLIAAFNPDCVVIGGGAGHAAVKALALVPARSSWFGAPVLPALLGDEAGVIGAALSAQPQKRVVMVNGVPAAGKSRVARAVSDATGWPLLTLDTVKNPFLTELPPGDRLLNRTLGRASNAAMFDLIADAPGGTFLVDAWFGFQPREVLERHLARAGVTDLAELWCHAPPEVVGARYAARLDSRPKGHPGADYVPELMAMAARAAPTGLAPRRDIDTTVPLDLAALLDWLSTR